MKKFLGVLALITAINITGCYTVIWTPEDEFPTTTSDQEQYDGYYQPDYYGPYVQYYNYPWWMSITPPTVNSQGTKGDKDKRSEIQTGRNDNGGRPNDRQRDIPVTPPASTNSGSSGSTGESSSGGNSGTTSSNTNTRSSDSSRDSGNGRNNDGGRSTDRGRR